MKLRGMSSAAFMTSPRFSARARGVPGYARPGGVIHVEDRDDVRPAQGEAAAYVDVHQRAALPPSTVMTRPARALGNAVVLAAGYKRLAAAYAVEDELLPPRVQLAQHVVEQEYRILLRLLQVYLPLAELDGEGRGALLAWEAKVRALLPFISISKSSLCAPVRHWPLSSSALRCAS